MPDFVMNSMLCTVRRQVAFLASHLSLDIVLLVACFPLCCCTDSPLTMRITQFAGIEAGIAIGPAPGNQTTAGS